MNYRQEGVSIIIPVYNAAAYIKDCLENVCSVDLPLKEIIVVNDGSTDNSLQLIEDYVEDHPASPIRVLTQLNAGVSEARNKGIDAAKYAWITFVDADDFLIKDLCSVLDKLINIDVDIFRFGFLKTSSRPDTIINGPFIEMSGQLCCDRQLLMKNAIGFVNDDEKIVNPPVCVWGEFFRSDFIRRNKLRFPIGVKNGEDRIFHLLCFEHTESIYMSEYPIYIYYTNPRSVTHRFKPDIRDISINFFNNLDSIVERWPTLKPQRNAALINNFFLEMDHFLFHSQNQMLAKEKWTYFINIYREIYKDGMEKSDYLYDASMGKKVLLFLMTNHLYNLAFLIFYSKYIVKRIIQK